jgi:hypothetical protein
MCLCLSLSLPSLLSASAQSSPGASAGACDKLKLEVEFALKLVARASAEQNYDESVPRATYLEQVVQTQVLIASANVELLRDNGCAKWKIPISSSRYRKAADECRADQLRMLRGIPLLASKLDSSGQPLSCYMGDWSPDE